MFQAEKKEKKEKIQAQIIKRFHEDQLRRSSCIDSSSTDPFLEKRQMVTIQSLASLLCLLSRSFISGREYNYVCWWPISQSHSAFVFMWMFYKAHLMVCEIPTAHSDHFFFFFLFFFFSFFFSLWITIVMSLYNNNYSKEILRCILSNSKAYTSSLVRKFFFFLFSQILKISLEFRNKFSEKQVYHIKLTNWYNFHWFI